LEWCLANNYSHLIIYSYTGVGPNRWEYGPAGQSRSDGATTGAGIQSLIGSTGRAPGRATSHSRKGDSMSIRSGRNGRSFGAIGDASLSRRRLVQSGAALGLTLPFSAGIASASAARPSVAHPSLSRAQGTQLTFFHDKDPWQDFFLQMSELST